MFSDGNMASSRVLVSDQADAFSRIPFDLVYHADPIDDALRVRNVVYHRHAEVLAPNVLSLDTLRWIGCRSNAERESLLCLLGKDSARWERRVTVAPVGLFNRLGCCVESVFAGGDTISFTLHIPKGWRVRIAFDLQGEASGTIWRWASSAWSASRLELRIQGLEPGLMRLHIEDCLAYIGRAEPADVPF